MKIAVPLFGKRISPHYGASSRILLIETKGDRIISKTVMETGTNDARQLSHYLVCLAVDRIICGGIQRIHKQWLTEKGLAVNDNRKGLAEEYVTEFIAQNLSCKSG